MPPPLPGACDLVSGAQEASKKGHPTQPPRHLHRVVGWQHSISWAPPVLDSPPTPPFLSRVHIVPSQRPGATTAPHPTPFTSRARQQVLSVRWTNPQPLPVHTPPAPRASPEPGSALHPLPRGLGALSGCSLTTSLSLLPRLPAALEVKQALGADLACRGLRHPVSADCCILKAHPLPGRTSRSPQAHSSPICKVHRQKGEDSLSLPGTVLICHMYSLTELPPVT